MKTHQDILDAIQASSDKANAEHGVVDRAALKRLNAIQARCGHIGHFYKRSYMLFNIGGGPLRNCVFCSATEAA